MKMRERTFYTAVGHFKKVVTQDGAYPVVLVNRQEYRMDPQEMAVWTILNWRLLDAQGVEEHYEPLFRTLMLEERRPMEHCLGRLVTKGLGRPILTLSTTCSAVCTWYPSRRACPCVPPPFSRCFCWTAYPLPERSRSFKRYGCPRARPG